MDDSSVREEYSQNPWFFLLFVYQDWKPETYEIWETQLRQASMWYKDSRGGYVSYIHVCSCVRECERACAVYVHVYIYVCLYMYVSVYIYYLFIYLFRYL